MRSICLRALLSFWGLLPLYFLSLMFLIWALYFFPVVGMEERIDFLVFFVLLLLSFGLNIDCGRERVAGIVFRVGLRLNFYGKLLKGEHGL